MSRQNVNQTGRLDRRQALRRLGEIGLGSLLAGIANPVTQSARTERPNFLFIMGDDHAARALSCYGSDTIHTPHLDRLAVEGTRFENCFVTNSLCAPTRGSMLTGTYAHKHGKVDNKAGTPFDDTLATFPELLQDAGYATVFVGKWHLQTLPEGFDYWIKLPRQGRYFDPIFNEGGNTRQFEGYVSDVITDLSLNKLAELKDQQDPFCLFCWHKAAHRPFRPPPRYEDYLQGQSISAPASLHDDYSDHATPAGAANMRLFGSPSGQDSPFRFDDDLPPSLSPREKEQIAYERFMRDYLGTVKSIDDSVGELLEYLDTSRLTDNTFVVYTSDNGFFMGEHGWLDKRFMYEESLRIPLLVRYPKEVLAGDATDEIALDIDLAPTFLDYAGAARPSEMQGRSLRPLLETRSVADWRTSMYYHFYENYGPHNAAAHVGIRTQRYKLIYYYRNGEQTTGSNMGEWEFFDLDADPHELHNAYDKPAYASIIHSMKERLWELSKQYEDQNAPDGIRTGTAEPPAAPSAISLGQPSPNPFTRYTKIVLALPQAAMIAAEVYSTSGRHVATLQGSTEMPPGHHTITWNGQTRGNRSAASGTYFIRVTAADKMFTRPITLLR